MPFREPSASRRATIKVVDPTIVYNIIALFRVNFDLLLI